MEVVVKNGQEDRLGEKLSNCDAANGQWIWALAGQLYGLSSLSSLYYMPLCCFMSSQSANYVVQSRNIPARRAPRLPFRQKRARYAGLQASSASSG